MLLLMKMAKGAVGQANINAKEVQSIIIIVPPMEAQEQFEELKQQSDKSKFELKQAIESIDDLIRSIVQQDLN